ncbi:MAG: hypothetical protein ACTS5I_15860 [Rhodanobacter sp.]
MGFIKFLIFLLLLVGGYQWWQKHPTALFGASAVPVAGKTGFMPMPQPMGTDTRTVLIYAPMNCPSETAQRARQLSRALATRHIPHTQLDEASFDLVNPDAQTVATFKRVMEGKGPVVFVRGMGKANPSFAEVVAEYDGATPSL